MTKRAYGLVSKLNDRWKCFDGSTFSTSHQAYSHVRGLRGRRIQGDESIKFPSEDSTPPLKRRKKDLELQERSASQSRHIYGESVDFHLVKPSSTTYLLLRHWFHARIGNPIAPPAHLRGEERPVALALSPSKNPSPRKLLQMAAPTDAPPRALLDPAINSRVDESPSQLLSEHFARWKAKRS